MTFPTLRFLFSLILTSTLLSISAQTSFDEAIRQPDVMASWKGCDPGTECTKQKIDEFIAANLVIPPDAKAKSAGGVVLVEFIIEKNGSIGDIRTLHDPGMGLGTAAFNVVSLMKVKKIKFQPALDKGKKIASRYMTPVSFNLQMPPKPQAPPTAPSAPMPDVLDVAEVMPRYAGCMDTPADTINCTFRSVLAHIQSNQQYPDTARTLGVQGPVVVEFIVDKQGKITNPRVTQGLGYGLDEEALRLINAMPAWQPGMQDGQPVAIRMVIPVVFQISKPNED